MASAATRARLVHSEGQNDYDFGPEHPMGPGRVRNTISLARALGVLDRLDVVEAGPLDEDLLRRVHSEDYIRAVQAERVNPVYGLGTTDNPLVVGMHRIATGVVAATVEAARSVWSGEVLRACNVSGGLHHALPAATSGFCVYNDLAAGIEWLLGNGCERVAYVDVDVHHGDGVQTIFYDDPRVLTVSLHETPAILFPGTGFATETGGPDAPGTAVNVALPPGTDDAGWLRAYHAVVPEAVRAFAPDVLVTQHGCDSHIGDPLADLDLTIEGQRASYLALAELADEVTGGRWVSTGGGGYAVRTVVPRAWTHLLAIVAGTPLDPSTPTPADWRAAMGEGAPPTMGDGGTGDFTPFSAGFDPASRLDQAIMATRRAVFPELGIDPGP
ncbi:MAG: acetoin utilization protein AcuC [Propionibacteriaceae bacterium]